MNESKGLSRPLMLALAVVFLFETWVWDSLVVALSWLVRALPWRRIERAIKDAVNRLPAIFAVLLFGVPLLAMEGGSAFAVVLIALGHVVIGALLYGLLKLVGVGLIAVIFDLTREKLMTLTWFAWLHSKFDALHRLARRYVAPYKEAVRAYLRELRERASALGRRYGIDVSAWRARWRQSKSIAAAPELD